MIKLENINKEYRMGEEIVHAVSGVSLEIKEGEFVALVGPSGSGKSTMMHIIGGLDTPTSGRVIVDGQNLSSASDKELSRYRNEKIGFVFQAFNLHPTYTATENVALPLIFSGIGQSNRMKMAAEALDIVGLAERASHRPNQLSGGERQRVSIARALVTQPKILLADEPTGNLDSKNGKHVMELLSQLNKEKGITLIIVTHDMEIAKEAGRIIKMRDGKIVEDEG
ncbi:MAG: ABC transporter ATP-binding protein [Dehalococcoidales bacterium]|jgi:putative ABC transport system ATP-binding protein|nr:ABC transporter ATP-binding protein [Dehalococcoidales bacterium]MDD3994739.1 ABC transporter ATP-binding protein [Dehalococcoidales bacterium]NLT28590.1 ABC transporter ATP-binding protein [Dehalococcoidales bacterium]